LAAVASPILAELGLACDPDAWRSAGFDVDGDGVAQVGAVRLRFHGSGGGISGWGLDGVEPGQIDGLRTEAATVSPGPAPSHPNGALSLDHLVLATPDLERTLAALAGAGFELRRIRDGSGPPGAVKQAFYRVGEAVLEVVGPPERDHGPAAFWGLVVVVADIAAAAAHLGPSLGREKGAVQPGRRIATVRSSAGLGTQVALMTPAPPK
jgi:hypothetical protein